MPERAAAASYRAWLPIALAGLCANFIGIGIGRFSYVAALPLVIDAQWATLAGAAQVAAANLIGYLLGGLTAHRIALRFGAGPVLRIAMLAVLASLIGCALQPGLVMFWLLRMLAGIAGAWLLILAPSFLLSRIEPARRGRASGLVFAGIGIGVVLSGFAVPLLGAANLSAAWWLLAICVALPMLYAWPKFGTQSMTAAAPAGPIPLAARGPLLGLMCAYVLDGIGYLPHTVFWVEYLVHGLGQSAALGGASWALFGAGAIAGPLICGPAADRFGFRRVLIVCFALKSVAIGLPLLSSAMPALMLSSFMVGALTPGLVATVSGRLLELVGVAGHQRYWARFTFIYAALQAAGGYCMAELYAATHSFTAIFAIGAATLALSTLIFVFGSRGAGRHSPS